ncbi:MAG: OmpA family protein [Sandaracinaceae bacterium]
MRRRILLGLTLAALAWAAPASAQTRFDPQFFHPTTSQRTNPLGVWSALVLHDGSFNVGLLGHYDHSPLVVRNESGERIYAIVGHQASMHVFGAFGLFEYLEIGADLPIILSQEGDAIPTIPGFDVGAQDVGAGIGDIRLTAKLRFFETNTEDSPGGAAMALVLDGYFPTGDETRYQGDDWRIAPRLVLDGITDTQHRVSLNVGFTYRQESDFSGLSVGPTFDWGLAATFVTEYVHVVPEIRGSLVMTADHIDFEEIPMEADLAIRILPIQEIQIQVGGGVGLFQGFGAPDFRVLLGGSYQFVPPSDRDGDGILNDDDECPDDPEDFDEFEDENGCPDPDNDQDQILDDPDECPNQPEDRDGFEDENGCPDPDNDQDGILDEPDECPNDAEDVDGFEDENGCPDPDNDQDRILDVNDQCPNDPEDMNGVEDEDGCPEVDSDGDGLLDPVDQCPQEPEDVDGFEDENGCPDPDNDQDGILDVDDRCPMEPEVINGVDDTDGCPDESAIVVTCAALEIHDSIFFETDSDVIRSVSFTLMNQIVAVMNARRDILRVSVEGHTDDRGSDEHNLDLSQRRAASVVRYLVEHGIAAGRLTSQGFGEARPIDSNRTAAGRANNRRVEFRITEQEGCQDEPAPAVP